MTGTTVDGERIIVHGCDLFEGGAGRERVVDERDVNVAPRDKRPAVVLQSGLGDGVGDAGRAPRETPDTVVVQFENVTVAFPAAHNVRVDGTRTLTDVATITHEYPGGAETVSLTEFAELIVQDWEVAADIVRDILDGRYADGYPWRRAAAAFRVAHADALRAQLADAEDQ